MYKPGETVHMKGWVRGIDLSPTGDVVGVGAADQTISWRIVDPYGNEYGEGTAPMTALGGFDFTVDLPKTVNLGDSRIHISAKTHGGMWHNISVQEFRRPEYEVNAVVDKGPHILGQPFGVQVNAAYFAGVRSPVRPPSGRCIRPKGRSRRPIKTNIPLVLGDHGGVRGVPLVRKPIKGISRGKPMRWAAITSMYTSNP